MVGCALTSIIVGLFDVKHYLHLQVGCTSRHHLDFPFFPLTIYRLARASHIPASPSMGPSSVPPECALA